MNNKKPVVAIILSIFLACLQLSGCKNEESSEVIGEPIKGAEISEEGGRIEYYAEKQVSLNSAVDAAFTEEEVVQLIDNDGNLELSFISKENNSERKRISLPEYGYSTGMFSSSDGGIYVALQKEWCASPSKVFFISKAGEIREIEGIDFGEPSAVSLTELKGVLKDEGSDYLWFEISIIGSKSGIDEYAGLDEGNVIINRIYEIKNGKLQTGYYQEPEEIRAFGTKYKKPAFIECGNVWNIETINNEKGQLDKYTLDELYFLSSYNGKYDVKARIMEDSLYYIRDGSMNCYSISKKTEEEVFGLASCGIMADAIRFFDVSDEGFEVITDAYYYKLALGESDKQTLVLACCGLSHSGDTSLQKAVAAFNSSNGKYIIKLKDYIGEDVDWDAAATALNLDIMSGDIPDMIAFWPQLDAAAYSSKGSYAIFLIILTMIYHYRGTALSPLY